LFTEDQDKRNHSNFLRYHFVEFGTQLAYFPNGKEGIVVEVNPILGLRKGVRHS
jgi:hypothetical protein